MFEMADEARQHVMRVIFSDTVPEVGEGF